MNMKKSINNYLFLLTLLFIGVDVEMHGQQNIQYSQYTFNTLSVNPAYAGYRETWHMNASHRMQWTGLDGAPRTSQITMDGVTDPRNRNVGLGLQLASDALGAQSATSLYASFAWRLKLNYVDSKRLSLGLGLGVTQYGLDGSKLRPVDESDPLLTDDQLNSYIPDLRFGIYYSSPNMYLGFSAMDLFSGNRSNATFHWDVDTSRNVMRKQHFYFIGGYLHDLDNTYKLRPSFLLKEDLAGPTVLDVSMAGVYRDQFMLGLTYRTGFTLWSKPYAEAADLSSLNALVLATRLALSERLWLGYSYDVPLNRLIQSQYGTHELTLSWELQVPSRRIYSPRFF